VSANEDQIKFWNEAAGENWTQLQTTMDRNLSTIHAAIMAFAAPTPGMAVLDIGCGTGTTTMALGDVVGSEGRVTGLDVSAPMLGLAKQRAQGRSNIDFVLADASAADFRSQYDLLFSRFGVMFFDDPVAAFGKLRRALKPGRRLAFVCWRTPPENAWASAPMVAAKPFLPEAPPPDPLAPGPFAFADPARIQDILAQAGFGGIRIEKFDGIMPMGRDLDLAAAQTLQIGPLSRVVGEADDAARQEIVAAVRRALGQFVTPGGEIAPPVACWLVAAGI
jgi:SAM-dependent methyltransferase